MMFGIACAHRMRIGNGLRRILKMSLVERIEPRIEEGEGEFQPKVLGIFRTPMPRPPQPPQTSEPERADADQQAVQRLFVAYNQCVSRVNHVENRLDQFRHAIQKDALDLAIVVHGHDQKVNGHCLELRQLTESVEEAQARITGIDKLAQKMLQHEHHVNQTIDRNTHSQTASISAIIEEQEDLSW